jgi:C1A family cysteine protease
VTFIYFKQEYVIFYIIILMNNYIDLFDNWIDSYKVQIQTTDHYDNVLEKWRENEKYIQEINSQNLPFTLGHNQFSGMSLTEFTEQIQQSNYRKITNTQNYTPLKIYNGTPSGVPIEIQWQPLPINELNGTPLDGACPISNLHRFKNNEIYPSDLPNYVNWVEAGAVTPVEDQGECGSCWTFSAIGALEGAYFIKTGKLISFSKQQLIDCDNLKYGGKNHGCNGGLMNRAFEWINMKGGICSDFDYPYISSYGSKYDGSNNTCSIHCKLIEGSQITDYVNVLPNDVSMMYALSKQPVSVAIDASGRNFQLYKSGVFTSETGINVDHAALAVGYGTENGYDYYLVKNSWGKDWGEGGYIKLGRGSQYNDGKGQCGILLEASYPIL